MYNFHSAPHIRLQIICYEILIHLEKAKNMHIIILHSFTCEKWEDVLDCAAFESQNVQNDMGHHPIAVCYSTTSFNQYLLIAFTSSMSCF
jgi:hypothetical protein